MSIDFLKKDKTSDELKKNQETTNQNTNKEDIKQHERGNSHQSKKSSENQSLDSFNIANISNRKKSVNKIPKFKNNSLQKNLSRSPVISSKPKNKKFTDLRNQRKLKNLSQEKVDPAMGIFEYESPKFLEEQDIDFEKKVPVKRSIDFDKNKDESYITDDFSDSLNNNSKRIISKRKASNKENTKTGSLENAKIIIRPNEINSAYEFQEKMSFASRENYLKMEKGRLSMEEKRLLKEIQYYRENVDVIKNEEKEVLLKQEIHDLKSERMFIESRMKNSGNSEIQENLIKITDHVVHSASTFQEHEVDIKNIKVDSDNVMNEKKPLDTKMNLKIQNFNLANNLRNQNGKPALNSCRLEEKGFKMAQDLYMKRNNFRSHSDIDSHLDNQTSSYENTDRLIEKSVDNPYNFKTSKQLSSLSSNKKNDANEDFIQSNSNNNLKIINESPVKRIRIFNESGQTINKIATLNTSLSLIKISPKGYRDLMDNDYQEENRNLIIQEKDENYSYNNEFDSIQEEFESQSDMYIEHEIKIGFDIETSNDFEEHLNSDISNLKEKNKSNEVNCNTKTSNFVEEVYKESIFSFNNKNHPVLESPKSDIKFESKKNNH